MANKTVKKKKAQTPSIVYEKFLNKIPNIEETVIQIDQLYVTQVKLKQENKRYVMTPYQNIIAPYCPPVFERQIGKWLGFLTWYKHVKQLAKEQHTSIKEFLLKQRQGKIAF